MAEGNNQNPWGGSQQRPPELDEVIEEFKNKFNRLFGNKKSANKITLGGGSVKYILILILLVWLLSGIYIIDPAEKGVVLRFGAFQVVASQGPHWHIPYPIESVDKINVAQIRTAEIGFRNIVNNNRRFGGNVSSESIMLTKDENMIDAKFAVQYRINDVRAYLFNVVKPDTTLRQVVESAIRQVVGQNTMDYVFEERGVVSQLIKEKSQMLLDSYQTGLSITTLNMKDAQPPEQVQASFDDAVKAREDKLRLINEAETYANGILPQARGEGARILQDSEAYKAKVIAQSEGETFRFNKILTEYKKAPKVTKERLYRETMERVLSSTSKVVVDSKAGNVMYLPIDKLLNNQSSTPKTIVNKTDPIQQKTNDGNIRNLFRNRGDR